MIFYALAIALASPPSARLDSPSLEAQAEQELRGVIQSFGDAIIKKDTQQFLGLFADGPVTWRRVYSDARLAQLKEKTPKAGFDPANSPRTFIGRIAQSPHGHEERFRNIQIDHDRDVAAITFDFIYLVNGRAINAGKESWHLVRQEKGWRIVSVIYSNNNPAR